MTHFDTFSGYGGFSIALERCGIETMGFSEVDKNANAVLKYHWPKVKNYGDISTITSLPDFDVLTGGSPCQDFSIAGKREGLGGARSSLAWEFIRILRLKKPKYFIWENVKGVMSSRSGWDFANIISAFSESGYSLWWQVLNAKNFGVPQNRERIFVVGFRDGSPKEVFFKSESGESNLKYAGGVISAREQWLKDGKHNSRNFSQGQRIYDTDGIAQALAGNAGGQGGKTGLYAMNPKLNNFKKNYDNVPALTATSYKEPPVISIPLRFLERNQKNFQGDYSFAVDTTNTGGIMQGRQVRRLTPLEAERLMGLDDDWTKYGLVNSPPESNQYSTERKELSDSARYKLCGNGVVVNCVEAIVKNLLNT